MVAMSNKTSTMPALGQDIQNVEVTVQKFLDVVRITLRDANHTRWEVPSSYHPGTAGGWRSLWPHKKLQGSCVLLGMSVGYWIPCCPSRMVS